MTLDVLECIVEFSADLGSGSMGLFQQIAKKLVALGLGHSIKEGAAE